MMYLIDIEYSGMKKLKELSDEEYDSLRKKIMQLPEKQNYYGQKFIVDQEGLEVLMNHGVKVEILNFKNTYSPNVGGRPIDETLSRYEMRHYATQIHLPNVGLMDFDKVMVLDDSCTEILQEKLDEGWRIIAVCPPNGARRPDYILGRSMRGLLSYPKA